jgi:hypothetical protein
MNPHFPRQKEQVAIPQDAQPGKTFKVMVPLPSSTTETASSIPVCVVCFKALVVVPTVRHQHGDIQVHSPLTCVTLRACVHFCCVSCAPMVDGKKCPTCNSPLPNLASLDALPYIQNLDMPANTVKQALLEEFYCFKESIRTTDKKEQEAVIAKGRDCQIKLSALQQSMGENSYVSPALGSLNDALEAASTFKTQLESTLESRAKKSYIRNFKRLVGDQLERGGYTSCDLRTLLVVPTLKLRFFLHVV